LLEEHDVYMDYCVLGPFFLFKLVILWHCCYWHCSCSLADIGVSLGGVPVLIIIKITQYVPW
jgi:hypothetical protein